jgi:hypothetical protein
MTTKLGSASACASWQGTLALRGAQRTRSELEVKQSFLKGSEKFFFSIRGGY